MLKIERSEKPGEGSQQLKIGSKRFLKKILMRFFGMNSTQGKGNRIKYSNRPPMSTEESKELLNLYIRNKYNLPINSPKTMRDFASLGRKFYLLMTNKKYQWRQLSFLD